jgi:cell division protein ZapD
VIQYEYPLNERIRTWLRLEELFGKALFFIRSEDARAHHAGLLAIFELVDVTARAEMKSELIHELERQKGALEALRSNPAVDGKRLELVVKRINGALTELYAMTGKIGQHVRDNEWLLGIKGRSTIPGGVCSFDLPSYHYWLNEPGEDRTRDLMEWLNPLLPLKRGVDVVLGLLRDSGHVSRHVASQGLFQLMLGGRAAHMIRIGLADEICCAPEASANKYALNVRFTLLDKSQKPRTCEQDIPFELSFCSL